MKIETYSDLLKINKHQLDEELVVHSDVLFRINERIVKLREFSVSASDELKKSEAEAFAAQKQMLDNGKPLSDTRAEMGARTDPFRMKAWTAATAAKAELERWEGLYAAWKDKGYNMSTLAGLYQTGNFSVTLPNRTGNKHDYTKDEPAAAPTRRRAGGS